MRNILVIGEFDEVYSDICPQTILMECLRCGEIFTEEVGTLDEVYTFCPHCGSELI